MVRPLGSRLFPDDPELDCELVQILLGGIVIVSPKPMGACWLALELWDWLDLDWFWSPRLPPSRQGTRWLNVLKTLATYRLIDPGRVAAASALESSQCPGESARRGRGGGPERNPVSLPR